MRYVFTVAAGVPQNDIHFCADAERAIMRVTQKLRGTEGADGRPTTIPVQVAALLREAADPENLCRMSYLWSAWV